MKRAITAAIVSVAFVATTVAASSATNVTSASGQGKLGDRSFSFSAKLYDDGTASGNAVLHNPAFTGANGTSPYMLQIAITCMKVDGNWATFGGLTRRTNDPSLIDAVFFSVVDQGEPGKNIDQISRAFFWDGDPNTQGDPQACQFVTPTDFPLETITAGNVQLRSDS
jgi:hypothetical protein